MKHIRVIILGFSIFTFIQCANAQLVFQRYLIGETSVEIYDLEPTSDGGFIGVGTDFTGSYYNILLVRFNSTGDPVWTKSYGYANNNHGISVKETFDNGFIIANDAPINTFDFGLLKTDINGNLIWAKNYGGNGAERVSDVQQCTDSGYVLTGYSTSYGAGLKDIYVVKTDILGNLEWSKTYGGTDEDKGNSIQQTADGGFIICGDTRSFGAGSEDIYIIKTDDMGDTIWTKTYGGIYGEFGVDIEVTGNGNYVVTGRTESFGTLGTDLYLIKIDSNGNLIWEKTYGSSTSIEYANDVLATTDGGYITVGQIGSLPVYDFFIVKTDSIGDTLWTKRFDSGFNDQRPSVQQTIDGGYIILGNAVDVINSKIRSYLYTIKVDSNGNGACNSVITNTVVNNGFSSVSSGSFLASGGIESTLVMNEYNLGMIDSIICGIVSLNDINMDIINLEIIPNPFNYKSTIHFKNINNEVHQILLFDIQGHLVYQISDITTSKVDIYRNNLSPGIYIAQLYSKDKIKGVCKLIIE